MRDFSTAGNGSTNSQRRFNQIVPRELITASELAELLNISERTLYRLKSAQQLPHAVCLGSSVRWRLTEVRDWIAAGCPPQAQFDRMRASKVKEE